MRFQQKVKSLIEIAMEKPNEYSIKQLHGAGKMYSLICKNGKIMIPKQIQTNPGRMVMVPYDIHSCRIS